MNLFFSRKLPASTEIAIEGVMVEVVVRASARARSYRLSLPHHGRPVLTVPQHGRWADAETFLHRQAGWLATRLQRLAPPVAFVSDAVIPLRGRSHRIVATGRLRGRVESAELEGEAVLLVPGEPAHQTRRVTDWLKRAAADDLEVRCAVHAARLGVSVRSVTMRSQSTRWGSCSSSGRLNFNWRLVLAPPFVLDYVAAHEVAHLVEMNHSPAFWATVERTLPDMAKGRAWLRAHGKEIMAYGRNPA